jgi:G3E family GTPase
MLRLADIVVVTKSDLVSQSEREVFMKRIHMINPNCKILKVNSQNHEWISIFKSLLIEECQKSANQKGKNLRYPMPSAICSYCLWEKSVRSDFKIWNYIDINL